MLLYVWYCTVSTCVGNFHFIESNMNQYIYLENLNQKLVASVEKVGINPNYRFYEYNDPKHTAHRVCEWLLVYNWPHVVKVRPQTLDLNVIENLWLN